MTIEIKTAKQYLQEYLSVMVVFMMSPRSSSFIAGSPCKGKGGSDRLSSITDIDIFATFVTFSGFC